MREVRTTATGDSVAWCFRQCVTRLSHAKTAERIDVLFEAETLGTQETLYWTTVPTFHRFDAAFDELLQLIVYQSGASLLWTQL